MASMYFSFTVTGSARQPITADQAQWSVTVGALAPTPGAAAKALTAYAAKARSFLGSTGLAAGEIVAPPFSTETVEERRSDGTSTGVVVGYRLIQAFTVTSKDIPRVEELAGRLSKLLEQGVAASARPSPQTKVPARLNPEPSIFTPGLPKKSLPAVS